jgi:hypothetical protein
MAAEAANAAKATVNRILDTLKTHLPLVAGATSARDDALFMPNRNAIYSYKYNTINQVRKHRNQWSRACAKKWVVEGKQITMRRRESLVRTVL